MTNRLSVQTSTKLTLRNLHRPRKCTKLRPVLQPLRWCCIKCVIHHERDVREEQHHTYMWHEKAIIEWSWHVNSIVACCHGAKLCAHAAQDFRSQQSGAVTRMWRSCQGQPSHKERAIGVARCKKEGMMLQPLRWCCVKCVIHNEQDVREEQHHTYMWHEQAIIEWSWHVNSIVACCHSAKLCAHAARDFRSQHLELYKILKKYHNLLQDGYCLS